MSSLHNYFTYFGDSTLPIILLSWVSLFLLWEYLPTLMSIGKDKREPYDIPPSIPIFGHIIGSIRHKSQYFDVVSKQNPTYPVFSISFPGQKMYIVTDPNLVPSAQRSKTLSAQALFFQIEKDVMGLSKNVVELMRPIPGGPAGEEDSPFIKERNTSLHVPLQPGPVLNKMNAAVLKNISGFINNIGRSWEEKNVWLWLRDTFTIASTAATFGAAFPLAKNSELIDALWDFDTEMFSLLAYPFPTITAKKGLAARTKLHTSLKKWYKAGHFNDPDVSAACLARINVLKKYGLSSDEIGEDNLGLLFVSTTNAMPTLYWFFIFVFNSPSLLEELRQELKSVLTKDGNKMTIDQTQFPEKCPLLCSSYQETMRLTNVQGGTRKVLVDTILSGSADMTGDRKEYLLKAGAILQTPSSITHISTAVWGPTADVFNPRRFMNLGNGDKAAEKLQKKAFIPFGGGKHYCPGRHFAFAEILGTIAVLVLGFEVEESSGGPVRIVKSERGATNAVLKPDQEGYKLAVRIKRRPGLEEAEWAFVEGY